MTAKIIAPSGILPEVVTRIVAVIYRRDPDGSVVPHGTAFFLDYERHRFLITARHLLFDPRTGERYSEAWIRLDRTGGSPELVPLVDVPVFVPEDLTIDVAVLPGTIGGGSFSQRSLSPEFLPTKEELRRPKLGEGLRIVYLGLFLPVPGDRNQPIARFGHVAMVPDGKVLWESEPIDAFLVELNAFGGASGGPVFVFLDRETSPTLLGVLKGTFTQAHEAEFMEVGNLPRLRVTNTAGIAAVVPSYLLHEPLFQATAELFRARKRDA